MSVTYEEAREIVRRDTEPDWPIGTYCLDDRKIVENDEFYAFDVGAREFLVDGDLDFAIAGSVPIVYKEDGRLEWLPSPVVGMDDTLTSRPNPDPTFVP